MAELVVAEDWVGAALSIFIRTAPRIVALAGGATPRLLYERLATADLGYPWTEVLAVLTDERCVPPNHPDSNAAMIGRALLDALGDRGPRILRMPGEACDPDAHEAALRRALGDPPRLDLAVLGLGEDGHTASLFPRDPALEEGRRLVARVVRPDYPRLTLTLPVLSLAAVAMFLAVGEAKRDAVRRFLAGEDLPAARVRAPRVYAVVDPAAAP